MAEQIAQIRFDSNPAFQNRKPRIANRTGWSRREFLKATALTGSSALLGLTSNTHAADPAPETTKIALAQSPALCTAPQIVAEELLRGEGFTDIQYLRTGSAELYKTVASGQAQLGMGVTLRFILDVDAGAPTVLLTGVHVGCYELFGVGTVRSVNNLKNKTVSVPGLHSGAHALLASMAAYVGLNPAKDIKWVVHPFAESMRLLADGKIDAFMGFFSRAPGAAREKDRPCHREYGYRPTMVAVFLLLACRKQRIRSQKSVGYQARCKSHPQGKQHMRCRTGTRGSPSEGEGLCDGARLCPAIDNTNSLRQVAGPRQ